MDWLGLVLYLVIAVFGWMNVYAVNVGSDNVFILSLQNRYTMQLFWMVVSLIIGLSIFLIDSRFFSFASRGIFAFSLLLLLGVLAFGHEVNNSKSWLALGPISIQPSEFAKLVVVLMLAKQFSVVDAKVLKTKDLFILFLIILAPTALIGLQPDIGSTMVFFVLLLVLFREGMPGWIILLCLFLLGVFLGSLAFADYQVLLGLIISAYLFYLVNARSVKNAIMAFLAVSLPIVASFLVNRWIPVFNASQYMVVFTGMIISTIIILVRVLRTKEYKTLLIVLSVFAMIGFTFTVDYMFNNVLKEHQQSRVKIMLGLESDPYGYEYNVRQSKIAIGSGGFTGKGFLQGTQTKYKFVPEQSTDFIFCTVGEEWGFLGSASLILLYAGLLIRLVLVAERQRSRYSRVYAYGVFSILFFHFMVNIAMTIGLFPVIGIPLPFFSYGGSSFLAFTIMLFILFKLDTTRKAYLI